METILIPGFWLDASSWDNVVPTLEAAGHRARPLTLPGLESLEADRTTIGLADHVAAVVSAIDDSDGPAVLVGHSGGGALAHAAVDARPDRVARAVYVDTWPLAAGCCINHELPSTNGEIPLPAWSEMGDEDLVDLDDAQREQFRARAVPQPARVATDPQLLNDPRRFDVPVTIVACEFTEEQLRGWAARGEASLAELASIRDIEFVELPTGHWPQFTKPAELGAAIVRAIDRARPAGD